MEDLIREVKEDKVKIDLKQKNISNVLDNFFNTLYPLEFSCVNCNDEIRVEDEYFCKICRKDLKIINNSCERCGGEVNSFSRVCINCKGIDRYFDKVVSSVEYNGIAKKLCYHLKYDCAKYLSKAFAPFLVNSFLKAKFSNIDIVTCVPINTKKLKKRGYNQAEEISKDFVSLLYEKENIRLEENYFILKRVKDTIPQFDLTIKQRKDNLRDAFEINCKKSALKNKTILVVDDIFTTGATMEEISRVLKENGVKKVFCLTFCHTEFNL